MSDDFESVSGTGGGEVTRHHSGGRAESQEPTGKGGVQTRVIGGATSVQFGAPVEPKPFIHGPKDRVYYGAVRVGAGITENNDGRSRSTNAADGSGEEGAAQDRMGRTVQGRNFQSGDVITHMGMQIPVKVAASVGILEAASTDASGNPTSWRFPGASESFSNAPSSAHEPKGETETDGELPDAYGLERAELEAHASIATAVGDGGLDTIAREIIANVDQMDDLDIEIIAPGTFAPNAELGAQARAVFDGLRKQAAAAVTARGVDPVAFYAWAQKHDANMLKATMRTAYETGDGRIFAGTMVDRFIKRGTK